jgi:hypothetical protein
MEAYAETIGPAMTTAIQVTGLVAGGLCVWLSAKGKPWQRVMRAALASFGVFWIAAALLTWKPLLNYANAGEVAKPQVIYRFDEYRYLEIRSRDDFPCEGGQGIPVVFKAV